MRRVVVTGMGAISGLGDTVEENWKSVLAGKSPRRSVAECFDTTESPRAYRIGDDFAHVCANAHPDLELANVCGVEAKEYDRHQLFALIAADEAMRQANLSHYAAERFGCIGGTGDGGLLEAAVTHRRLYKGERPFPRASVKELPNLFTGYVANKFGLKGVSATHCGACAASAQAISHAALCIAAGLADQVLVVGAEAAISPFGIATFNSIRALASDMYPYQVGRRGFVMGEGAAALVLESETIARDRGAKVLALVAGHATTADGVSKGLITDPNPNGGRRSAELALEMASLGPHEIDYINTHGTGTQVGDAAELEGVRGWARDAVSDIPISSTKSYTGHLLGAAGAIEAIFAVKAIETSTLPATRGLTPENLDPKFVDFGLLKGAPTSRIAPRVNTVLSNSFGFGGTNATLIFQRYRA